MATYTKNEPTASEVIAVSQPILNNNFGYISEMVGKDHNFTNTSNTSLSNADGYHKVIHFVNQGGDPGVLAGVGQLYTKTIGGDQQLIFESGGGLVTQLTGPNAPVVGASGYLWLPGGVLMQWAKITLPVATEVTFTYGVGALASLIAFPNACFGIVGCNNETGTLITSSVSFGNILTTGFHAKNSSSSGTPHGFFVAYGN